MMRAVIRNLFALALCALAYALAVISPTAAQISTEPGAPPPPVLDVAPFRSKLDGLAREYLVQTVAEGHSFRGMLVGRLFIPSSLSATRNPNFRFNY